MKWLKKIGSDNEQSSNAGSQSKPEDVVAQTLDELAFSEPETFEPAAADNNEAKSMPTSTKKHTVRRRGEREAAEHKTPGKLSFIPLGSFKNSWIGHNWKTLAILLAIFCVALFVRSYYGLEPATRDGILLSGGSDSYYYHYVIQEGSESGQHLFWDNMINYPLGSRNPRPPLYSWPITVIGLGISPLFDGDVYESTFYVFIFSTAFLGAITIFPTYLLGKEAFGKRAGIVAAFILAVLPGHVSRSVITNGDHDAAALFLIVLTFYFFLKALKTLTPGECIASWNKPREIYSGVVNFTRQNPQSLLYGVMAGLSIAATSLVWQGFAYVIVVISFYFIFQIFINRFRNVDTFGVFAIYFVSLGTGLFLALPYYYLSFQFLNSWFGTPLYLFLGLSAFSIIMMATRKYPWLLVFISIAAVALLSIFLLWLLVPSLFDSLVTQLVSAGGYVIRTKQYETIAEAQAPPFSNLALSFGIFTFWLTFIGIAWAAIQLPKSWKPYFTFILLWAGTSVYLAVTAARFMFNASPAFAIISGWIIALIIEKLDLKKYINDLKRASKPHMTHHFKIGLLISIAFLFVLLVVLTSISESAYPVFVIGLTAVCGIYIFNLIAETNPNRIYNLLTILIPVSGAMFYMITIFYLDWVFTGATHGFILSVLLFSYMVLYIQVRKISFFFTMGIVFLAFCVVTPNVWASLDAGIPYEVKADYDKQIYNSMPVFMQPDDYDAVNGSNWYLGGFGYSLPLNSRYWPAAYRWLATQDAEIYPDYKKPAFLSWWDYGFEIVNQARHPTVADNFLGGHQLAGNFIMAQSEEDAIALLCVRLLEAEWADEDRRFGPSHSFDAETITLLEDYGIDTAKMIDIFENPAQYIDKILANPDLYGLRDDVIQNPNAKYIASRVLITQTLDLESIVNLYLDISHLTGHSIRYFGIDSRLFPFSAQNTGIFYAPAKLSDHRISDVANQPYDFWEIKAVGEFGGEYDLDDVPPDVNLDPENPYKLVYKDMFYNSMLYRAFIGYSGQDIGQGEAGIPAVTGSLSSNPIMPGWNMSHFKLVHRTAYWNPYSEDEIQNHTDDWEAMNYWDAYEKQQAGEGISDLSDRSSVYQGTMMLKYYHGAIISGIVTLEDGTPLAGVSVTVTDDFRIPKMRVLTDSNGYYSVIAPPGDITLTASTGEIDPLYLMGNSQLNVTSMHIEDYQAMRENGDRNGDGIPDYLINQNLAISGSSLSGVVFWDVDSDGVVGDNEEKIADAKISITNSELEFETSTTSDENGKYVFGTIPPGSYSVQVLFANRKIGTHQVVISDNEAKEENLAMTVTPMTGTVVYYDDMIAGGARVRAWSTDEDVELYAYADRNGTYHFENILPGRIFVQAVLGDYASTPQTVEVVPFQNITVDHVLYNSFSLTGSVTLNGVPVPYSTIKFAGPSSTIVNSGRSGEYSVRLIDGEYIYMISHTIGVTTYTAMGRIYMVDNGAHDIRLQQGCTVNGRVVNEQGIPAANTQVMFDNLDSEIYVSANTDEYGDYSFNLPQGRYNVQISSSVFGSYYGLHELSSQTSFLDISTRPGTTVSGFVYWDVDGDGEHKATEGLSKARITFKESTGEYAQAITDETGSFNFVLPPTVPYHITVSKKGFHSVDLGDHTLSALSGEIIQNLEPMLIPVTGSLYLDDEILTEQNIKLNFISEISALPSIVTQIGRDGTYSEQVLPGLYTVSFTHNITAGNDTNVYQIENEFIFDTGFYSGEIISLDLEAAERTKISVSISNPDYIGANITFKQGPETRSFDMDTNFGTFYLRPGDYVLTAVHALNETIMVDMQDVSVNEYSNNFTISLKNGLYYTGTLRYGDRNIPYQRINFKDSSGNGTISAMTDENGAYDVFLVPNLKYEVLVDFVDYSEEPYLLAHRYFSSNHTIDARIPTTAHLIELERELYSINLVGSVTISESIAPNTVLTFISGFQNYTALADTNGNYSLEIVPGEYTVFAHQPSSHHVALFNTFIEIEQIGLDVFLSAGKRLYGTAYYERDKNTVTNIQFTSTQDIKYSLSSDETGYYEVWLPPDNYTITGDINTAKDGMEVVYTLDMSIELYSDRQVNLPFSLDEERIVFVSFDPTQIREVSTNTTVTYSFEVENMGNIRDTYDVVATGAGPDWITEVSTPELTLEPGTENIATSTVTVHIPPNAKLNQNSVTLTAISQKNTSVRHSNVMNLIIRQQHEFTIQPSATPPIFVMGDLKSEFSIMNQGNGPDRLTVYIANNEDLLRSGWIAELGDVDGAGLIDSNKRLVNVSVDSDGTVNIPINLYPASDNPSRQASVLIIAYSQLDGSVIKTNTILLKYPELQISADNLSVTGMGVSTVQSGDRLTNAGVMAISVASALIIFYYARKKRWIR